MLPLTRCLAVLPCLLLAGCVTFVPTLTIPEGGAIYTDLCWRGTDRDTGNQLFRGILITLQRATGGESLEYWQREEGLYDRVQARNLVIDRAAGRLSFALPERELGTDAPDLIARSDATAVLGEIGPDRILLISIDGRPVHRELLRQMHQDQAVPNCAN